MKNIMLQSTVLSSLILSLSGSALADNLSTSLIPKPVYNYQLSFTNNTNHAIGFSIKPNRGTKQSDISYTHHGGVHLLAAGETQTIFVRQNQYPFPSPGAVDISYTYPTTCSFPGGGRQFPGVQSYSYMIFPSMHDVSQLQKRHFNITEVNSGSEFIEDAGCTGH